MYVIVSQVAAPAMTSVRVVDPRSEMWKYRSSDVCPAVLGLGGDQIAICAPFLDTRSAPRRRCAQGTDFREDTGSIGTPRIRRKGTFGPRRGPSKRCLPCSAGQFGHHAVDELLDPAPSFGGPVDYEIGETEGPDGVRGGPNLIPGLGDRQVGGFQDGGRVPPSPLRVLLQDGRLPPQVSRRPERVPYVGVPGGDG